MESYDQSAILIPVGGPYSPTLSNWLI